MTLDDAITAYDAALGQIKTEETDSLPALAMSVLLARDRLARVLAAAAPTAAHFERVHYLDSQLQNQARRLDERIGRAALISWRETVQPPAAAWWWRLD